VTTAPGSGATVDLAPTTHSYTELARLVRESGLMRRRYSWYWWRIAAAVLAFVGVAGAVVAIGNSWWQLVPAAVLGLVVTQFGFLGHDAAHRQIFVSAGWNDWTARILAGVFAGLSYRWWQGKHPDIAPGMLAFTREIAEERTTGISGWFTRHQGWLFFPLLTFEGLNLHVAGIRHLCGRGPVQYRSVELGLVSTRLAVYLVGLLLVVSPEKAVAFVAVQLAVFGVCLGGSFAPNHKGMPIVPKEMKVDFLRRQVLMSRNVRGGPVVDFMMGGLNYQIEHHLFPSMARPQLKELQPVVRDYCESRSIAYAEVGLWESYAIVVDYLNHVGLRARDPFDCPMVAQLRR
jgi:fatty acid desaturase